LHTSSAPHLNNSSFPHLVDGAFFLNNFAVPPLSGEGPATAANPLPPCDFLPRRLSGQYEALWAPPQFNLNMRQSPVFSCNATVLHKFATHQCENFIRLAALIPRYPLALAGNRNINPTLKNPPPRHIVRTTSFSRPTCHCSAADTQPPSGYFQIPLLKYTFSLTRFDSAPPSGQNKAFAAAVFNANYAPSPSSHR